MRGGFLLVMNVFVRYALKLISPVKLVALQLPLNWFKAIRFTLNYSPELIRVWVDTLLRADQTGPLERSNTEGLGLRNHSNKRCEIIADFMLRGIHSHHSLALLTVGHFSSQFICAAAAFCGVPAFYALCDFFFLLCIILLTLTHEMLSARFISLLCTVMM